MGSALWAACSYRPATKSSRPGRAVSSVPGNRVRRPSSSPAALYASASLLGNWRSFSSAREKAAPHPSVRDTSYSRFKNSAISVSVKSSRKDNSVFRSTRSVRASTGSRVMSG